MKGVVVSPGVNQRRGAGLCDNMFTDGLNGHDE